MKRLVLLGLTACALFAGCAATAGRGQSSDSEPWMQALREGGADQPATQPADALPAQPALSDYLAYAARHNPGLHAAFDRWRAAVERIVPERSLSDPQFTYRYFYVEQPMRDGDMRHMYEIAQQFPWIEKLQLRGDIAARQAQAQQQRYEAERLKLFNRVKQAYYEYYYLARAIAVTEDNLQQLAYIENIARARYQAAAASQPDVIRAQVEMGKVDNDLRSLKDMRGATAARLNAALNLPADTPLPWPTQMEQVPVGVGDRELLDWLARSNPELKAMEFDVAAERLGIDLAGKDYLPDLMVGYEFDQMVRAADLPPDMDMKNPQAVMFSLNIPIWWDKYAAEVRQARARLWAATREREEKANSLASDVKTAAYNLRNAERKVALYRDRLLPQAQQSLKSLEASYRSGTAVFTDIIDAQRILLEFQLSYQRSLADRQEGLAELEMLVGVEIPRETAVRPADEPAASRPVAE